MRSRISLALALTTCLGAISAGCDGNGGPVLVPDSGPTPNDSGTPPVDAFTPDTVRPQVTETSPEQGATGVAPDATITVTFSEEMDESAGTVSVRAGTETREVDLAWSDEGTTLTITPRAALPSEARVTVTLDDDFADLAGNTLALPYVLVFGLGDTDPPVVASSDPAQGATDLSARLEAITIVFDEQMDNSVGTLALSGGAGTIGTPDWIDGRTLRAPISGLAYGTTYRITPTGFTDAAGNALDASVYLDEGAIEITTGGDDDAPQVTDSVPSEGQVNVALRGTPSIVIVFDEPMSTSAGTATLHAGGLETVLAGTWSDGGRRLTMPVAGRLYPDAPHSVVLAGFVDVAGNALDTTTYLGDGALDFDTGADATVPIVVFSYPNEGSTSADFQLARIEIAFDRAMDQETVATVRVDDGEDAFDANVTWNLAGTRAYVDVSSRMRAGRAYAVDLRAFVDLNGDPVDPDAPYLGNGVLDFQTRAPRGEMCRDELRVTEATSTLPTGGHEWVIGETTMRTIDNSRACQYAGADSTSYSPDAVLVYRKTTGAGSSGGRYLRVSAESAVGSRVTLAVYRDACSQASPGGPDARLTCQWDRYRWDQYLDVGAGDYYVWVATTNSSTQQPITVRIEEVEAVPAGESCANPLRASATEPSYTPPATAGGEHVWEITGEHFHGADMDDAWPGTGAVSCDEEQAQGVDYVVEYQKASADSLVSVVVEPLGAGITDTMHVEMRSTCDARDATGTTYVTECGMRPDSSAPVTIFPRRFTFRAPAGPMYLWVANDLQRSGQLGARIRVQEIPDVPGSSCANAIALGASGSFDIAPSAAARSDAPSCMRGDLDGDETLDDGVTWYRLTSTAAATVVRANAATPGETGAIAVFDANAGREVHCGLTAAPVPMTVLGAPGRDVCIAVRNEAGITRLDVAQAPYTGVMGVPTEIPFERPTGSNGNPITITSENWMVVTPTTLYMSLASSLLHGARTGGQVFGQHTFTSSQIGSAGVAIGEAVWSLDDSASSGTTSRLFRLVNASGASGATAWDTGTSWPADAYDSMTYDGTSFFVANDYAASVPVQIRRFDPAAPGAATPVGALGSGARDTLGLAADATWFFFAGAWEVDATTTLRGIFRVRRSELGTATPELIAALPIHTVSSSGSVSYVARVPMFVDSTTSASYLYARANTGEVHAVMDPGGATPVYVGAISPLGDTGDFAMAYDPADASIFLFETETVSTGRIVRLD
ncbi:Ig-like domain-containing protein [Sandaracinus amylolyticus]|uniref:Ig-like domain-containing protein n=1 Tax=Sandaracinus amylolyticus TaxID=927083 RepID=UPI001F3DE0AF|nr:Ig-like domain-containing protein [Sandaracinus amylolyticus]